MTSNLTLSSLFSGQSYRNFIQAIHSPFSRQVYTTVLKQFMQYRKVDNCDRLLEGDPRLIQSQLIEYIIYLKEERKEEKVKKAETQAMFVPLPHDFSITGEQLERIIIMAEDGKKIIDCRLVERGKIIVLNENEPRIKVPVGRRRMK